MSGRSGWGAGGFEKTTNEREMEDGWGGVWLI